MRGLMELGCVVGRNLLLDERYADGHLDCLHALAEELVRLRLPVEVTVVGEPSPGARTLIAGKSPMWLCEIGYRRSHRSGSSLRTSGC